MSVFNSVTSGWKWYRHSLGLNTARSMLSGVGTAARGAYGAGGWAGIRAGAMTGGKALGRGARDYFWKGQNWATRASRMGTAGAALWGARNFVDPRNNFGPW